MQNTIIIINQWCVYIEGCVCMQYIFFLFAHRTQWQLMMVDDVSCKVYMYKSDHNVTCKSLCGVEGCV